MPLPQRADDLTVFPAVVLAIGTAWLDVSAKQRLLFLFSEPTHPVFPAFVFS